MKANDQAKMLREPSTVDWDAEGGATKNGLHLFAGPVLSGGFISLVTKQGQTLYMEWHPTLEAAQAAAVAWVDGRDDATDLKGLGNHD